ncbi:unnamed protein product [Gongylonema pulchrum]|uniref:KH domain-containing protein n=1 Tax=Gongylonema pulchrum TaxID=637853 RepID=A0A183CWY9_9BILA|nr:unnamed protein product [Gongylonema pulchrum]
MSLQKEDVYETEDLPEDDQQLIEDEVHEGEEVQRVHIDVGEAMKRFKGRLVNAENVDFSDSIARKKRRGYGGGAYVLEVVGPYADENETLEQKLTRLECEVNDLVEALRFQEPQKEDKSEARVAREDYLISLLEELKAMKVKRNMIEISPGNEEKYVAVELYDVFFFSF